METDLDYRNRLMTRLPYNALNSKHKVEAIGNAVGNELDQIGAEYQCNRGGDLRYEHYRSCCDNPNDYDKVIDWIAANNPYAGSQRGMTAEDWAATCVNDCIRSVVWGSHNSNFVSTGMCMAVRLSGNPNSFNYKKVVLAIKL